MTESEIRNAFASYKHPFWGVVGLYPSNGEDKDTFTCDNYHFFNALYWRVLHSWGYDLNGTEVGEDYLFTKDCLKAPGLYSRFPSRMNDDVSQDEIYGICTVGPGEAGDVAKYGAKNLWCYNLAIPGKFKLNYFFARFPSFVAYVKACAGKPIYFSQFAWCLGFLCSALTSHNESTGKLLSYLQIPIMEKKFIPKLAIIVWRVIMKKRYPSGAKELMKIYFGDNHPFINCARGDWR